jgi:hypothetical protein
VNISMKCQKNRWQRLCIRYRYAEPELIHKGSQNP